MTTTQHDTCAGEDAKRGFTPHPKDANFCERCGWHVGKHDTAGGCPYTQRSLGAVPSAASPTTAGSALSVQEGGRHYKDMPIQPVEYIHKNGIGYFEGCVIKYVSRWRKKNGIEDLKKARHFIDLLIELETQGVAQ